MHNDSRILIKYNMFFVCGIGCMFGTNIDSLYGSKSFLHRVTFLVSTLICLVLQIHSLDISAGGALGVSASSDGHLRIWETATGIVRVSITKLFTQNNLKAVLCSCQCDDEPVVTHLLYPRNGGSMSIGATDFYIPWQTHPSQEWRTSLRLDLPGQSFLMHNFRKMTHPWRACTWINGPCYGPFDSHGTLTHLCISFMTLNPLKMIWFGYNMHFPLTPAWVYSWLVFNGLIKRSLVQISLQQ